MTLAELKGHAYERVGVCSMGDHPLAAGDGHYHTLRQVTGAAQPVCCACAGAPCATKAQIEARDASTAPEDPAVELELDEVDSHLFAVATKLARFGITSLAEACGLPKGTRRDYDRVWRRVDRHIKEFTGDGRLYRRISKTRWEVM